ncbi:MAG: 23S rRNA (adenine(2503)-C(2))-methyltransferase RlmN [Hyphomicrobiaceae bacterium]|nr:23S rRNA (adenine(2503)-C(2))-methyltransferase RlmN [Hyphomicrobiaceae bacterium]
MNSLEKNPTEDKKNQNEALKQPIPPPKTALIGLDREQLGEALLPLGVKPKQTRMRINQLWNAIYARGHTRFDQIQTISKELRAQLEEQCSIARPEIVTEQISNDGTRKWLLRLKSDLPGKPGPQVEMVYIPEHDRGTLCISSQVGCTLNCRFCHTGTMPLVRNLTAGEIVGQVMLARDRLGDWPENSGVKIEAEDKTGLPDARRMVTRLVFMGMGEPLYNFENVKSAAHVLNDDAGINLSSRRITLSTAGVVPQMERAGDEIKCMLAVSLHATNDKLRDELVPINRKYPLAELMQACRDYPGLSNTRRITFEYVMLDGINDSLEDAKALVQLLKGIPAKINLIPFNPWPNSPYECSNWAQIERFAQVINDAGYASPIRRPRGRDIMAACGQLKSESERISNRERKTILAGEAK